MARTARERAARVQLARERAAEQAHAAQDQAEQARLAAARVRREAQEQARIDEARAEREREAQDRLDRQRAAELAQAVAAPPLARGGGPNSMPIHPYIGIEGGAGFFDRGLRDATGTGGNWGARVGLDVLNFLAVEARYFGAYNPGNESRVGAGVGLVTNGGSAVIRLIAPLPVFRPYAFVGIGAYNTTVTGTPEARQGSSLRQDTYGALPVGIGFDVMASRHVSIGAEGTYHRMLGGANLAVDPAIATGDLVTGALVLKYRM